MILARRKEPQTMPGARWWLFFFVLQVPFGLEGQAPPPDATARLMKEFTEAHGPSGSEGPVGKMMMKYLSTLVSEVKVDGLGSIIGTRKGSADGPRIMLAAHMDEVGFIV